MTPTALRRDGSYEGRRALIVDDNETNLRLMTALLSAWGVQTRPRPRARQRWRPSAGRVRPRHARHADARDGRAGARDAAPRARPRTPASSRRRSPATTSLRSPLAGDGIGAVIMKPLKASPLHGALATVFDEAGAEEGPAKRAVRSTLTSASSPAPDPARGGQRREPAARAPAAREARLPYRRRRERARGDRGGGAPGYDLVLIDVQMPEMDGVEATRQILERWAEGERPWIVAMTAEAMRGDRERFLAAGMNDYLAKPIRPQELIAAIKRTPRREGIASRRPGRHRPSTTRSSPRLADSMGGDDAFVAELIAQFVADRPRSWRRPGRARGRRRRRGPARGPHAQVERGDVRRHELADAAAGSRLPRRAARSTTAPRSSRPSRTSSGGSTPRSARAPRSPARPSARSGQQELDADHHQRGADEQEHQRSRKCDADHDAHESDHHIAQVGMHPMPPSDVSADETGPEVSP